MNDDLTLEELSERTGVEARTLRSWISEGLLAPPFKPGRGARYPASNVDRALAVRSLKDVRGLSFSEIGRRFMMATNDQIREWALEAGPTTAPSGSARDYLRQIGARNAPATRAAEAGSLFERVAPLQMSEPRSAPRFLGRSLSRTEREPPSAEAGLELASIERLILQLDQVLEAPAPRRSRGTAWTRIPITPDLEFSVRGDLEPREQILFEQLADQLRAILTGRAKHG